MDVFKYYQDLATNDALSNTEKCGRYASQQESEKHIFTDTLSKLPTLNHPNKKVIDVGCGCSYPVLELIEHCHQHQHQLTLVDSKEMLDQLPNASFIDKIAGQFPQEKLLEQHRNSFDVVIAYGVFQCVYSHANFIAFSDALVDLLAPGGMLLIGDISNNTKKKRYLSSESGREFHKAWSNSDDVPEVSWNQFEPNSLDDTTVIMLYSRYRQMGYETYIFPQMANLPFSHSREDLLVAKW